MRGRRTTMLRVVVVGGSVGGLSCAHALLRAGGSSSSSGVTSKDEAQTEAEVEVVVLEKARSISPQGAGLALDEVECCPALRHWGFADSLAHHTIALAVEENRVIEPYTKSPLLLVRNPSHNCKAMHWSDLHKLLYDGLPDPSIVRFGHEVIGFEEIEGGTQIKALVKTDNGQVDFIGDLLVAADGCNSRIRAHFLPDEKRRYLGYSAWRGVVDKSASLAKEVMDSMHDRYPDLGKTVYVEMAGDSHSAVFEIPGGRINWLWYVNQEEPRFKGTSLTRRARDEDIAKMIRDAEGLLTPEMVGLIKATEAPFLQAICDRDPIKRMVWGRVVLLGEAAHPTTPHAARSTNMSIMDAVTLGNCLSSLLSSSECVDTTSSLSAALSQYEAIRLPQTNHQLLFSRYLGQLKQGHLHPKNFSWLEASPMECQKLIQAHWHMQKGGMMY